MSEEKQQTTWPAEDSVVNSGFVRVVLVPEGEQPYSGGRLRLLTVEFYRGGIVLTWLLDAVPDEVIEELRHQPSVERVIERLTRRYHEQMGVITVQSVLQKVRDRNAGMNLGPSVPFFWDDLGNRYWRIHADALGLRTRRVCMYFSPGLAEGARQLVIKLRDLTFTVDV